MDTTEQLKELYSSQLASQKEQLKQGYMQADAEYAAEKEKAQKVTDANLTRTAVEAQKAAVNNAELHNAYGLSSGARAQDQMALEAAKLMADAGDYTRLAAIYGLSPAELKVLMGDPTDGGTAPKDAPSAIDLSPIYYDDNVPTTGASGSNAKPTAQPQTDNLVLDQNSIIALGFGAISAETLNKLIEQGVVEEYVEGGKLKFRKTAKGGGMPYSTALMPNR